MGLLSLWTFPAVVCLNVPEVGLGETCYSAKRCFLLEKFCSQLTIRRAAFLDAQADALSTHSSDRSKDLVFPLAGASAVDLKRGLTLGLQAAANSMRALSRPVSSRREKAQVATVCAHNNAIVGDMVAEVGAATSFVSKSRRQPRITTRRNCGNGRLSWRAELL